MLERPTLYTTKLFWSAAEAGLDSCVTVLHSCGLSVLVCEAYVYAWASTIAMNELCTKCDRCIHGGHVGVVDRCGMVFVLWCV